MATFEGTTCQHQAVLEGRCCLPAALDNEQSHQPRGLRDFVDVLDDLWLLDFESLRWIELCPAGAQPPG